MKLRKMTFHAIVFAFAALVLAACTQVYPTHVATLQANGTSGASGSATARLIGDDLTVEGTYENLSGEPNSAEVYDETAAASVFALDIDANTSGGFNGAGQLTNAQLDHLENGALSVRIYTDTYPESTTVGELEGNLTQN